jgi:hypothetical protein
MLLGSPMRQLVAKWWRVAGKVVGSLGRGKSYIRELPRHLADRRACDAMRGEALYSSLRQLFGS